MCCGAKQTVGLESQLPLDRALPHRDEVGTWVDAQLAVEIKRHQGKRNVGEIGPIPVQRSDLLKANVWRSRSRLNVPKECCACYPGCERGSGCSLLELVSWLRQWHNEWGSVFGESMDDYCRGSTTEARILGFTLYDLRAWKPAATAMKRGRNRKA